MACVKVIAETLAALPLHLMREENGAKRRATDRRLYEILHDQPNERQTSLEFREMMQGQLCLRGNAFSLIKTGRGGSVDQLVPLDPDRIQVFWLKTIEDSGPQIGRLGYLYRDRDQNEFRLTQDEVFHLRAISLDGILGLSVISASSRAVNLAQQADIHGEKWWENAAKPGGVVKLPVGEWLPDEDAHKRLKDSWRNAYTGDDLYTVAILEGGAEWQQMGVSMKDAEFMAFRRFQVAEIARLFRVPVHMINSAIEHGMTYANVEHSDLAFVKHTMIPWLVRWEQAIKRDLIPDAQHYAKHSLEGLLRGDTAARAAFYKTLWEIGVLSINEIRSLEDWDAVDGGDQRFVPSNTLPLAWDEVIEKLPTREQVAVVADCVVDIHQMAEESSAEVIRVREDVAAAADAMQTSFCTLTADMTGRFGQCDAAHSAAFETLGSIVAAQESLPPVLDAIGETMTAQNNVLTEAQSVYERDRRRVLSAWANDIASRIAAAERDELSRWLSKRTPGGLKSKDRDGFDKWVAELWRTRMPEFIEHHIAPWTAANDSKVDSSALAGVVCSQAIDILTGHENAAELKTWMDMRADKLAAQLQEECLA